jgi:hypothetical protein
MRSWLAQLSSLDSAHRRSALAHLLLEQPQAPTEKPVVNMHLHTFFSFNGEGWSPSRIAWEAREGGLYAAAICDFDVLDGVNEFLAAAQMIGLRAAAGFESRVFFPEYAGAEINSPGEPGVFYFMGMGFCRPPEPGGRSAAVLADMLARSHQRNRDLIGRINRHLPELGLEYDRDVMPLTPAGNPTERHLVRSYYDRALAFAGGDHAQTARYWASKIGGEAAALHQLLPNTNGFVDLLRSKMMKKGGLGYVQPSAQAFPKLDEVIAMILDCQAIPMSAWLDGTSAGESEPEKQLECLVAKGVAAVNIIPDRNWNLKGGEEKTRKVAELNRYVRVAEAMGLPINVGTELNKPGQRFVDDFEAEAMLPLWPCFRRGAQVMVGHTRLLRYARFSYVGKEAAAEFPERTQRSAFFAAVGALPPAGPDLQRKLNGLGPGQAFACLRDSARKGTWV